MTDHHRPAGRPTKYDPNYCDLVIEDAKQGFSLSAFAGGIQVDRTTISEWRSVHPEFDQACRVAKLVRARFLETGIMKEDIPGPAMNARKFALVNCAEEDWREKQSVELTGANGGPIQSVSWTANAPDDLLKEVAKLKGGGG